MEQDPNAPPSTAVQAHNQAVTAAAIPQYKSHKVVGALRIISVDGGAHDATVPLLSYDPDGFNQVQPPPEAYVRYFPTEGDYLVFYPDGYLSFSPKSAFEEGYAPVGLADTPPVHVAEPAAERVWAIKDGQTVTDENTGATVRFGSYGDHSNSVFLQIAIPPASDEPEGAPSRGSTLVFARNGEVHRILSHQVARPAQDPAAENGDVATGDRAPTPEPFQPNPGARSIGAKPGPDAALPPQPVAPYVPPSQRPPLQGDVGAAADRRSPQMRPVQPLDEDR